ncbi:unnamed protein product, partial [Prorocentrum cordatum]
MAPEINARLHGELLRDISGFSPTQYSGLRSGGADLRMWTIIPIQLARRLARLGDTFAITRHITDVSASELRAELSAATAAVSSINGCFSTYGHGAFGKCGGNNTYGSHGSQSYGVHGISEYVADGFSTKRAAEITKLQASHKRHLTFLSEAEVISPLRSLLGDSRAARPNEGSEMKVAPGDIDEAGLAALAAAAAQQDQLPLAPREEKAAEPVPEDLDLRKRLEDVSQAMGKDAARGLLGNAVKVLQRLAKDQANPKLHEMRKEVLERIVGESLFFVFEAAGFEERPAGDGGAPAAFVWRGGEEAASAVRVALAESQRAADLCLDPDAVTFTQVSELVGAGRALPGIEDVDDKALDNDSFWRKWDLQVAVRGGAESHGAYASLFWLRLRFCHEWPAKPPAVRFLSVIHHRLVEDGEMQEPFFTHLKQSAWDASSRRYRLHDLLTAVRLSLTDPHAVCPEEEAVALPVPHGTPEYQGTVAHPALGPDHKEFKMQTHAQRMPKEFQGRWEALGQRGAATIFVDHSSRHVAIFAQSPLGDVELNGEVDEDNGTLFGDVIFSGSREGSFSLVPVPEEQRDLGDESTNTKRLAIIRKFTSMARHPELFAEKPNWTCNEWLNPGFSKALAAGTADAWRDLLMTHSPGEVYSFPFFTAGFCEVLLQEVMNFYDSGLPAR